MGEGEPDTASEGFHQLTETIPLPSSLGLVLADTVVWKVAETVIHYGERIHDARAWLHQQGFHLRSKDIERFPEPFYDFREVYGVISESISN
jgi:hypothetical protein